jgi:hypothetical protein
LGGIYSLQPLPSCWLFLLAMGTPDSTVHCSVRAMSARLLGFGTVDRWTLCPVAAPDSSVPHRTCPMCSDFSAPSSVAHCSPLFTFGRRPLEQVTVALLAHRTCPVNYSGARPIKTREWSVCFVLGLVHTEHCPGRHLAAHSQVLLQILLSLQLNFFIGLC